MKSFIKFFILTILLSVPLLVSAKTFDSNLYFGITNNPDVQMLQEFLTDQGVYSGPITGNFFSLTLAGVKNYQSQNNITPAAGFFGPITRSKANDILSVQLNTSDQQAVTETGAIAPTVTQNATTNSNQLIQTLQTQILALQQQLIQMQQQNQTIQNQQTQIQSQQTQIQSQQTQIQQNQQSQISSIQQQTNQQTSTNQQTTTQTSTQTQIQNQVVQQSALSPSLSSDLIYFVTNYPKAISAEFASNIRDPYQKRPGFSWEFYVNDQKINSDSSQFIINNLAPETIYNYKLIYKEPGREDSIKVGTFKTLSKLKTVSCGIGASWQNNLNLNSENNSNTKQEYIINCDPGDFVSIKLLSVDLGYWLNYATNFSNYIPIIVEVNNSGFSDRYLLDPVSDGFGRDGLSPGGTSINFMTHQLNLHDTLIRKSDFIQSGGWLLGFKIITQNPNNGDGGGQGSPFRFNGQLFNLTFLDELGSKYTIRVPRNSYDGVYLDY